MSNKGNLIYSVKEGESIQFEGGGFVTIKLIKKNKVVVLINSGNGGKVRIGTKEKQ